jgi:hypothetical protein
MENMSKEVAHAMEIANLLEALRLETAECERLRQIVRGYRTEETLRHA